MGSRVKALLEETEGDLVGQILKPEIFTRSLPAFAAMISQDLLRWELRKAPEEVVSEYQLDDAAFWEVPEVVENWLKESETASLLWIHYLIDGLLPSRKRPQRRDVLVRYCKLLPSISKMAAHDLWSHLLVYRLIQSSQYDPLLTDETIGRLVVHDLLVDSVDPDDEDTFPVNFQLLRLVVNLKEGMSPELKSRVLEQLVATYRRVVSPDEGEQEEPLHRLFVKEFESCQEVLGPHAEGGGSRLEADESFGTGVDDVAM